MAPALAAYASVKDLLAIASNTCELYSDTARVWAALDTLAAFNRQTQFCDNLPSAWKGTGALAVFCIGDGDVVGGRSEDTTDAHSPCCV